MPRKKQPQTAARPSLAPSGYDKDSLAKLGAVVRAVNLKTELRELEKAFPGTMSLAEYQIQKDNLAHARAVRAGQITGAKVPPGPAASNRQVVEEHAAAGHERPALVGA